MSTATSRRVSSWAAISAAGWVGMFGFTGAGLNYLGNLAGVVYHLALLPVVLTLASTTWSRAAGLVWIFCDTALNVASINGLDGDTVWALRLGIHIAAATWIVVAARGMPGRAGRVVGVALGGSLATHALLAPWMPPAVLALVVFPLMTAWLVLIAAGSVAGSDGEELAAAPA